MSSSRKQKAAKLFAKTKKGNDQAAHEQDTKIKERAEHIANLKSLRLAKAESDKLAEAVEKPKKKKSKKPKPDSKKVSVLPQTHRQS